MLISNENLPHPNINSIIEKDIENEKINKILNITVREMPIDEKGHPYLPSNGKRYWKEIRKLRRTKNNA